eukprot:m.54025 g.54025  ORF g.54025 m.54025 type:complete len:605 (+) comp11071_c0_seq4:95-1909(+)
MKKVECSDEAEAEKAFKEAVALETLSHQYVCGYRELFVNWDKEEATMFVCIVMDYYEAGDLDNVIRKQRAKEKALPETVLKKWVGQLVEALAFVHGKKVIHRDLKPSNLFMTQALDIRLGDFGVATVMEGAKTKTRTTVGTMNYMAPEVLERPYNEKSDIWSLGCIILDAATCAFLNHGQAQSLLFEVKHKPHRLEEALKEVERSYSKDLCQTIRMMLRRNFHQRPSTTDLVKLPYVHACLELSKSDLVKGKDSANYQTEDKPKTTKRIPTSIPEIAEFLTTNIGRIGCQVSGIEEATKMVADSAPHNRATLAVPVLTAMMKYTTNLFVQVAALSCIRAIADADEGDGNIRTNEVFSAVLMAMKSHPGNTDVQRLGCESIVSLSSTEEMAKEIGALGGVQDVLNALRGNVNVAIVAQEACRAIFSLTVCDENALIIAEERGLEDVRTAMESFIDNGVLVAAACSVLWTLSAIDELIDSILDLHFISLVTAALQHHNDDKEVIQEALSALSSLAVDEMCAMAFCDQSESGDSLVALSNVITTHIKNPQVCEAAASLISELSEHEDIKDELIEGGCVEMVGTLKSSFIDDEEIQSKCESALGNLTK